MQRRPVTHKDIAEYVKVTQSTVSRALDPNKRHLIGESTRKKIISAAEKLGFRANVYAKRIRQLKTDTLTLIIDSQQLYHRDYPDFHVHHEGMTWELICGVISFCAENGFDVKLLPLMSREEAEAKVLSKHLGYPYSDGVIFLGYKYLEAAHRIISERKIPAVIMNALPSQAEELAEVSVDPTPGIKQAVRYLIDKGHKKIAFFQHVPSNAYGYVNQRRKAFEEEMKKQGLFDPELIYWASDEFGVRKLAADKKVIDSFTAMLCTNDSMADRWMRELNCHGISVPDQKALIGFDNNPAYPEISTVDVPRKEIGRTAAGMLIDAIQNERSCHENIVLESKFIPRKSC
jgi:DNA-binding LacI/PurR family transcriptional regulator